MRCSLACLATVVGLGVWLPSSPAGGAEPAARRAALLRSSGDGEESIPFLRHALQDENMVVRRTAARLLGEIGAAAQAVLVQALGNEDSVVRQVALKGLLALETEDHEAILAVALDDVDMGQRLIAVRELAGTRPQSEGVKQLLAKAAKDSDDAVRSVASRALWSFSRHVVPLRERPDWDHEVEVIAAIPLPREAWRFRLDPQRNGHESMWFEPGFDDGAWDTIAIEQAWQAAGYEHTGVAWYRRWLDLPAQPEGVVHAVELSFGGVDECAWVWFNGVYVGEHDIGPSGWDKPFSLDVSDAVVWGQRNQITVRAMNTAHAGGIWRPVKIEVLR